MELLGSKSFRAKMRKKCMSTAQQLPFEQKKDVMKTVTIAQENAEDILAEAKQINEKRTAEEAATLIDENITE